MIRDHIGMPRQAIAAAALAACIVQLLSPSPTCAATRLPRVLEMRGLWYDMFGVDRAVSRSGGALMTQTWPADKTISWYAPASPADLTRYQLVVVANIPGSALSEKSSLSAASIKQYVAQGGSVLLLGGFYGFGQDYHGTPLEEIAPVDFAAGKDLIQGEFPVAAPGAQPGYSLAQKPIVLWMHDVTAKPGARIVLTAGGKPLLITGTYGNGRVAVFSGTVMGNPGAGQAPFWSWDEWPKALGDTVSWLLEGRSTGTDDSTTNLADSLKLAGGKPAAELHVLLDAADRCRAESAAAGILDALVKGSWPLALSDADRFDERLGPYIDQKDVDIVTRLTQSDDLGRISIGLRLLGQVRPPGAQAKLTAALKSGEVEAATASGDDLAPDVGTATNPEDRANAIRLAAVIGLGRLGDPAAIDPIRSAKEAAKKLRSPTGSFPITPTAGDQIVEQADIAALRCGDSSPAEAAVAAVLAARTTLAATMIEMSIPLVGRGPHEMEKLRRLNARRAYGAAVSANADIEQSLIGLPADVLPAVATTLSRSDDPWTIPIAYTIFGKTFRPTLPPNVADTLKTAKLTAITDLAVRP